MEALRVAARSRVPVKVAPLPSRVRSECLLLHTVSATRVFNTVPAEIRGDSEGDMPIERGKSKGEREAIAAGNQ